MIRSRWPLAALILTGTFLSASLLYTSVARAGTNRMAKTKFSLSTLAATPPKVGDGLCALRFDAATGTLRDVRVVAPLSNPDWLTLSPNSRTLYAGGAPDGKNGLSAFAVENDGDLREISAQVGDNPVSLAVDATGKWLVGAYYNSGTWAFGRSKAMAQSANKRR